MSNFSTKYDEGKSHTSNRNNNGPGLIGSDLDMSDGSDMDLSDDESSYASSRRSGGGTYGSHNSFNSRNSNNSHHSNNQSHQNGNNNNNNNHNGNNNNNNHTQQHQSQRKGEAKMSPPPSRQPRPTLNVNGGGFGAAVPKRNVKNLGINIGASIELGGGEAPSYDVTESVFIKGDLAINRTGVRMRDRAKTFVVDASELQLGKVIGRGSSSYVQHAVHTPTGTQVALKVINMFDKGKRDQLMQEISTLYDAACPSIIGFYGAFYREGTISIALEFMDGGSLANMVHQLGPLEENVLAHISYQIVYALAYLRKHLKRVHRDIKPSNVLINSKGLVKLSDFGLSAELQNSIAMCATFVGTFKYMSPERIKNLSYGQPADVWSLGITLLECATGSYPYHETGTYIEMVQTVLESPEPCLPDNTERVRYTKELREFTSSCVHKNPKQRVPADILLGSPWFRQWGATGLEVSVEHLRSWIHSR